MKKEFRMQRNKVVSMVNNARKDYFNKMIDDKKDTRSIWKAYNEFTNVKSSSKTQPINISPDVINDFFLNLSETILTEKKH